MPRKKSVFVTSEATSSTLSIKVPDSIKYRIKTLQDSISKINPRLAFDPNTICVRALENALDNGESELDELQSKHNGQASIYSDITSHN